jgi:hypothetical protein
MRTNLKVSPNHPVTHEGALAGRADAVGQLRRSVMACMLFEDEFYEDGVAIAERIAAAVKAVPFAEAAKVAVEARERFKLRHVPLHITAQLIKQRNQGRQVGDLIAQVIQRPDELGELCAMYWKDQKDKPLTKQMKVGLARAIRKFSEYQLAKWNKEGHVKLRDVLFLSHAKPEDASDGPPLTKAVRKAGDTRALSPGESLYKRIAEDTMATPDTWEVELSAGKDKKVTFERLIRERKLGALALLRNLRNMVEAKVDEDLIRAYLGTVNMGRVLPFRFISAAEYAPRLEDALEAAMYRALAEMPKLGGKTAILVDHSGSMQQPVSAKSKVTRFDAAGALAIMARELCDRVRVFTFSDRCVEVAPRRGFAMLQAVREVINPVSTYMGKAVKHIYAEFPECERIVCITDEQSADRPPQPQGTGYVLNVCSYQHGIAYGPWLTINGFSEAVFDFIREHEAA